MRHSRLPKSIRNQVGGAAMEYVVVSTFALLVAIAGVTFVGKLFKEKMHEISDKIGTDNATLDIPEWLE